MKLESDRVGFIGRVRGRLNLGAQDVADQARRNLGGGGGRLSSSVTVVQLGPTRWRIGTNHPGAMAQERGAFIRPKRGRAIKFAGRWSAYARIKPKRWLSRAGRRTRFIFHERLRGAA